MRELAMVLTSGLSIEWPLLLSFALAILVVEFFDISLPRGDTLGVSGALDSAAIVLLGPFQAVLAALVGTSMAFVARRRTDRHTQPAIEMPALISALAVAVLVDQLGGSEASGLGYHASAFLVAAAYLATELVVVQIMVSRDTSRSLIGLIKGNVIRQAPLLAAQLSASVLAVIIHRYMAAWGLALVVVLLLLIRQSYAMLLDIRETYRTTVEVLVEAAERPDARRHGHSERTAAIARAIGSECGLTPSDIERISYASLLHDVDAIGYEASNVHAVCRPSEVLTGVRSFEDVARLLEIFEGRFVQRAPTDSELLSAYVLALATDIDSGDRKELRMLHGAAAVERLRKIVPRDVKAKAVAAALRLGYGIPAVS